MNELKAGEIAYLVDLHEFADLVGRTVEIVGAVPTPPGEGGRWFQVRSAWGDVAFGGTSMVAERLKLRPIQPPAPTVTRQVEEISK